ncbi:hypothetical protein LP419_29245 [Massilia sp. H-1]|nr:hypothetical protein LP419_29245 [Massilia sp. H-1]
MKTSLSLPFALCGLLIATQAPAATPYDALMKAKKYAEAEKAASLVLTTDPANAEAMAARTEAILATGRSARIEEAVKQAQQCVAARGRCPLPPGAGQGARLEGDERRHDVGHGLRKRHPQCLQEGGRTRSAQSGRASRCCSTT